MTWYGLLAHVGDTRFFIGRPAPTHGVTTSQAMVAIGESEIPPFSTLEVNTNTSELVDYLGGLIGIEENLHVPAEGQTRRALAANLRHALYYCFQGQGEVANPDLLFHRQNRDFQKQAIRDTLPYFLGAQSPDALRKREKLSALRRDIRRQTLRLEEARAARELGLGRAAGLIAEARASGLLPTGTAPADAGEAFELLSNVLNADEPAANADAVDSVAETESLIEQRAELRGALREINDKIRGLDEFARVGTEYSAELNEHRVRLASIGLIPESADAEAICPVCQSPLEDPATHEAIAHSLGRVARRIELAQRDLPRITAARAELILARNQTRTALADVNGALDELARTDDLRAAHQRTWEQQSFVLGRIAQFLDTITMDSDDDIATLERTLAALEDEAARLTEELDPEALRSAVNSLLNIVGRRMTELARSLPLEHSDRLEVTRDKEKLVSFRLIDVAQLAVFGRVQVSTQALQACFARGIPVLWLSSGGWLHGFALGQPSKYVELRRRQTAVHAQGGAGLAQRLIAGKILNCRTLLRRNARGDVSRCVRALKRLADQAREADNFSTLLGIEGTAARLYFGAFPSMLADGASAFGAEFSQLGRNRRPPPDPLNALLSFCYSMLSKDLVAITLGVGLDPYLGIYHRSRYGRPAMALDLAEEFRP